MTKVSERYSTLQIGLHWLIALLLAYNWIVSDGMGRALRTKLEGGIPEQFAALTHPPVGIAVLVLTAIRLLVRARQGAPAMPEGSQLLTMIAKWGHRALYGVLLLIPISGIAAWTFGIKIAGEGHELLVNLGVILVIGHVAAALYHQFFLKDGLLDRMRPGKSASRD